MFLSSWFSPWKAELWLPSWRERWAQGPPVGQVGRGLGVVCVLLVVASSECHRGKCISSYALNGHSFPLWILLSGAVILQTPQDSASALSDSWTLRQELSCRVAARVPRALFWLLLSATGTSVEWMWFSQMCQRLGPQCGVGPLRGRHRGGGWGAGLASDQGGSQENPWLVLLGERVVKQQARSLPFSSGCLPGTVVAPSSMCSGHETVSCWALTRGRTKGLPSWTSASRTVS